ncbi:MULTISPECIES: NADase-type glycan-binding domain-containing protein [Microbacterium]|uniref:NAD glycohydrolase translocation F5/8 type C domain-containing protein n=1 Tax=Microbacterium wangchenii TaxID=2541726 RepID=A0ABX5SRJ9_9MICO|nr:MULTISPECIES: hypothetical protein [Microbacterium]MCK6066574.1 hypothetical protein [Microbacterium sp. EYE_512]QBR87910.1 hypothetical protein E4K62_03900 [Microbacterium wangchenii]TFV83967.1 hypothetical protein E4V99_02485 [Microbacterium sp. dk485]TXK18300.1 hypothetical protein FVP99_06905 [Microbacterium wangchenii]
MPQEESPKKTRPGSDWSTFWPSFWITLLGTGLIGGVVAAGVVFLSARIQQGIAEEAAAIATCDNPQQLRLADRIEAVATSELQYEDASGQSLSYPATQLVDGSRQTAWIAGEAGGGVGAQISLRLPAGEDVRVICILNGYAKTNDLYDANGSVRVLEVATENGARDAALPRVTDANIFDYQALVFAPGMTQEILLTIQASDVPEASAEFGPTSAAMSEIEIWVKE